MSIEICDSCGNSIVVEFDHRPYMYSFSVPANDDNAYDNYTFTLCTECIRKIVDFITSTDETEPYVEMRDIDATADGLRRLSDDLDDLATELEEVGTE